MTVEMTPKTILIVEDNELNLKLVRDLVKLDNHDTLEAMDAEAGLDLARKYKPDLILMDIELPGINGLDATRAIREDPELQDTPVLALTAYAMEDDKVRAREAGCDGYITKPINIKSFRRNLNHYLFKPASMVPEQHPPRGHRILIVDDEALNLKLLGAQLSSKGYHVTTAGDGETALRIAQMDHPDLILLDIMMPGLDGYQVTSRLKADPDTRNIPIILVTALSGDDEKKKGLAAGADEFINKPVNYAELEARVFSLIRLKEYQDQLGQRRKSESLMVKGAVEDDLQVEVDRSLPTVLVVEDDSNSAKLMSKYLSCTACNIETASCGEDALRVATRKKIDIVLLDLLLPSMDGFEVCRTIKENEETFPIQVVMVTSLADTKSKLAGIEAGTDEFLVKPLNKDEFQARIRSLMKKKAYLDRLRAKIDRALHAAITDRLTGVYNHGYFKHFIDLEFKRSKRHKHHLALLMIDVDDFKVFNDRYGHPCGDRSLRMIANILRENVREIDLVARYGGEEFTVCLPYAGRDAAVKIADRLLRSVAGHGDVAGARGARLSVSIGIALFPGSGNSARDLIRYADMALYSAKRGGKNQYCIHDDCGRNPGSEIIQKLSKNDESASLNFR